MSDDNVGKKYEIQLITECLTFVSFFLSILSLSFLLCIPLLSLFFVSGMLHSIVPSNCLWEHYLQLFYLSSLTPLRILYFLSLSAHLRSLLPALSSTSSQAMRPLPPRIPLPVHPLSSLCTHPPTVPAFPISHTFSLGRSPS